MLTVREDSMESRTIWLALKMNISHWCGRSQTLASLTNLYPPSLIDHRPSVSANGRIDTPTSSVSGARTIIIVIERLVVVPGIRLSSFRFRVGKRRLVFLEIHSILDEAQFLSVEQLLKSLVEGNAIGKECSGVVYHVELKNGEVIHVKKLWSTRCVPVLTTTTAGSMLVGSATHSRRRQRHSGPSGNIVKFLDCCSNRNTRLLMYDYMLTETGGKWVLATTMKDTMKEGKNPYEAQIGFHPKTNRWKEE
ncbi:leucine-rich receptor-like protein kinase family protein [Striga asiatica]|uniref:Leucine-rich receptor-like protein kinase family protein n=1 Tax=Striga asiatica TaxID=4170 RepID=A0A5A7NZ58_STRAF|nr:leucine-rich receptor-like protein kinase family protein [Striga asiatica]